ncbi:MAG: TonB-dependent receptor, partial [Rhizobiales bacterium]|nr:TonB-dependent receptor [Rhizobacter sp.]
AFGSIKYDITTALGLRAGVRYTKDNKELASNAAALPPTRQVNGTTADLSDSKPSGDLALTYKLTPDANVYARVASGYRGSSVQPASLFGAQSIAGQVDTVW